MDDTGHPSAFEPPHAGEPAAAAEAAEVARLLARAGVDHASAMWFQLQALATRYACDWAERSADSSAPLSARAAALLGLRTLAVEILTDVDEERGELAEQTAAGEACLKACLDTEREIEAHSPEPARRWGEGAEPRAQARPRLLEGDAGCC